MFLKGGHCLPILFVLFSEALGFTNDLIFFRIFNSMEYQKLLQEDLDRLDRWFEINKVRLNISKCCHISFFKGKGKVNNCYSLKGVTLSCAFNIKGLSVIFDENLSFMEHINTVTIKLFEMVSFIIRSCRSFSANTIKNVYCSLLTSRLEYGLVICSSYHAVHISATDGIQHNFLRVCSNKLHVYCRS